MLTVMYINMGTLQKLCLICSFKNHQVMTQHVKGKSDSGI